MRLHGPRNLGLAFVILGTLALIGAITQHRQFMKRIGATERTYMWSLPVLVAILVALIGVLAFIGILVRRGPF